MPFVNGGVVTSFNHGVVPPNVSGDLGFAANGSPTIQTAGGRQGSNALRCTSSASTVNVTMQRAMNSSSAPSNAGRTTWSFYFRFVTKPGSGTVTFATATASAGSTCSLQLNTTSGFIELIIGSGTAATTSVNPTTS